jgi:5'-deoxynucleotidase YfbR-like HD superfamily hydrolase
MAGGKHMSISKVKASDFYKAIRGKRWRDLLHLIYVPRWTIVPHSRPQSVAEHSFRVAAIFLGFVDGLAIRRSIDLGFALELAICHDRTESLTSDIPSPVKNNIAGLEDLEKAMFPDFVDIHGKASAEVNKIGWRKEVYQLELYLLRLADLLESCIYIGRYGDGSIAGHVYMSVRSCIYHDLRTDGLKHLGPDRIGILTAIVEEMLDPRYQ